MNKENKWMGFLWAVFACAFADQHEIAAAFAFTLMAIYQWIQGAVKAVQAAKEEKCLKRYYRQIGEA